MNLSISIFNGTSAFLKNNLVNIYKKYKQEKKRLCKHFQRLKNQNKRVS